MRMVTMAAGLALAFALSAAQGVPGFGMAEASSPVSTAPLAAGEVLLEVNAIGNVSTRADLATFTIAIQSGGATDAEARRAAEAEIARLAAAARAAGIAAGDFSRSPVVGMFPMDAAAEAAAGDLERAAAQIVAEAGNAPAAPAPPQAQARASVTIRLRDVDRVPALREALAGNGRSSIPDPVYSLADSRRARDEARRQAIASARADAETYAAALGLRVARIVRVTDRMGMDIVSMMMSDPGEMRRMINMSEVGGPEIAIMVPVGIDFALAPR